jgi:hypothetical protein
MDHATSERSEPRDPDAYEAEVYLIRPANICLLCCLPIEETDAKQQGISLDGDKSLEPQHDQGNGTGLQLTSTISRHVASHLQFLTFLTLRLFASKLVKGAGEEHHFDSSVADTETNAYWERSILKDHVAEAGDNEDPPVTDKADLIDWKHFNIKPRNDDDKNWAIEHMGKIERTAPRSFVRRVLGSWV